MTIPPEGQKIIEQTTRGEYWSALGVHKYATLDEIATAHLKLLHRYRGYPEVIAALNQAKVSFQSEPKGLTSSKTSANYRWNRTINIICSILFSWPIRMLSIPATLLVLINIHNLFLLIPSIIVLATIAIAKYRGTDQVWYIAVAVILLLGGGSVCALYKISFEVLHLWKWLSVVLAIIGGITLFVVVHVPLVESLAEKVIHPGFWNSVGIACAMFMFSFGIVFLLVAGFQADRFMDLVPLTVKIKENVLFLRILWFGLTMFLFMACASLYSGGLFTRRNWTDIWSVKSDGRYIFELMATLLSALIVLELLFYITPVRELINSLSKYPVLTILPIRSHFQDIISYYGLICVLTIPIFLILSSLILKSFKKSQWFLYIRLLAGTVSFFLGTNLFAILVPILRLQIRMAGQFIVYQNAIFGS